MWVLISSNDMLVYFRALEAISVSSAIIGSLYRPGTLRGINYIPEVAAVPSIPLEIKGYVRARHVIVPEFSVQTNVSKPLQNDKLSGYIDRTPKSHYNNPDFEQTTRLGYGSFFRNENAFHAQKKYKDLTYDLVRNHAPKFLYYTTTFDTSANPLTKEDNTRTIDRVFVLPALLTFTPQNEIYQHWGIQFTDKTEVFIHMGLFLEKNYRSLMDNGVKPLCDPGLHDPEWSQRGYSRFVYHGFTAEQIFPKAGDLMKLEYNNILYSISSITDENPDYEYMYHKYWWKAYLEVATDNGQNVSESVKADPIQQHFIDNLFGSTSLGNATDGDATKVTPTGSGNPLALDKETIQKLKEDVLYRPPEVDDCVKDVSADPNAHPCGELFGKW